MMVINIGNKQYKVKEARTEEQKRKGLQGIEELPENEGMLFCYDPPEDVSFWMKDVSIPLDMIFIDENDEVFKVYHAEPNSEKQIIVRDVAYVLEVNDNSGIKRGDILELENNTPTMKVLFQDGSEQYQLWGGERIFSRKNTRVLIKKAKKAEESNDDKDYKALGRFMFKCIKIQDERDPEYVEAPTSK